MTKQEVQERMTSLLKTKWPDVKVNIFGFDESFVNVDVVSDLYDTTLIHERLDQVIDVLDSEPALKDFILVICPVSYEQFANRNKEEDEE